MPVSGGGFEQAYNAQAGVDHGSRLIVENHVSQNPNDKQELQPALDHLSQLPETLGQVDHLLGDNGYFSEANVKACEQATITPCSPRGGPGTIPPQQNALPTRVKPPTPRIRSRGWNTACAPPKARRCMPNASPPSSRSLASSSTSWGFGNFCYGVCRQCRVSGIWYASLTI